jgi:hypothetical protein
MNTAFVADYVHPDSIGGSIAFFTFLENIGRVFVQYGLIEAQKKYDLKFSLIYACMGVFTIVGCIPMLIWLDESKKRNRRDAERSEQER